MIIVIIVIIVMWFKIERNAAQVRQIAARHTVHNIQTFHNRVLGFKAKNWYSIANTPIERTLKTQLLYNFYKQYFCSSSIPDRHWLRMWSNGRLLVYGIYSSLKFFILNSFKYIIMWFIHSFQSIIQMNWTYF